MQKARFNPTRHAETFDEFMLDFIRNTIDSPSRPMGNVAASNLLTFVYAALVGYLEKLEDLIPRNLAWIDGALERGENCGGLNFHRSTLLTAKGLYLWLLGRGAETPEVFKQSVDALQQTIVNKEAYTSGNGKTQGLDDGMVLCFLGQDYERGMALYEQVHPKPVFPAKGAPPPRAIGYWLCVHAARGGVDGQELHAAARRMLKATLDDVWLGRGHSIWAATWLMAIHWYPDRTLTPVQTLLKAYDDMPLVQRPAFTVASQSQY